MITDKIQFAIRCLSLTALICSVARADDAEQVVAKTPLGQFVTVTSPVDDQLFARVSNAALNLQSLAASEGRQAYLVLQIEPGTSQFHQVQGLAKFLTSPQVSNVTTVAWIPHTVTGSNVLLALACRQIIMHPEAELGDIGRGQPLDPDDRQAVLALAQKRHNPKVNIALARGMMDQNEQLWKVRLRSAKANSDELESRVVTKDELESLRKTNVAIEGTDVVKEGGMVGTFRGATARNLDILVTQLADSRSGVGELLGLPREALREQSAEKENRRVRLIKVDGVIDRLQESFLARQVDRAVREGAQVVVFQFSSPGGEFDPSFNLAQIIAQLEDHKIHTIAYIPDAATSGAAIVALACDEIIMHPAAKIGDMRPIDPHHDKIDRIVAQLRIMLTDLAVKKHRPSALYVAMADHTAKVFQATHRDTGRVWYMSEEDIRTSGGEWLIGPQLSETNGELLLEVSGQRAHELKLAEPTVHDFNELKGRMGLPPTAELRPIEKTWVDALVFQLNSPGITVMLVIIGAVLIYLEQHTMTGILGILSVLCFALFFWSRFLGGTADWLEVVLFVLGIACLAMEVFVMPGFGVFGFSGIAMILASLVMAGHSWSYDLATNIEELTIQAGWVVLAFALLGVFGVAAAQYLPQLPMFEAMILGPPGSSPNDEPQLRFNGGNAQASVEGEARLGQRGMTITMLRPAGKAQLGDRIVNVISEGPFIGADAAVEIVELSGNRIVVRQI
jgi:membrane-bound serine protease (ClpP class)